MPVASERISRRARVTVLLSKLRRRLHCYPSLMTSHAILPWQRGDRSKNGNANKRTDADTIGRLLPAFNAGVIPGSALHLYDALSRRDRDNRPRIVPHCLQVELALDLYHHHYRWQLR